MLLNNTQRGRNQTQTADVQLMLSEVGNTAGKLCVGFVVVVVIAVVVVVVVVVVFSS